MNQGVRSNGRVSELDGCLSAIRTKELEDRGAVVVHNVLDERDRNVDVVLLPIPCWHDGHADRYTRVLVAAGEDGAKCDEMMEAPRG